MKAKSTAELEERIAFLENVLECLPLGILVLDPQGKIMLTNRNQEVTSQIKREDVLGQCFHKKWRDLLARTELGECYWSMINSHKPYEYVFHDVLPQFFDVKISGIGFGAPLDDKRGFILLHHISDRIREDKHALSILATNLAESKKILQGLFDSSPSAIFTLAKDGTIRSSNRTASRIFGYTKGEVLWKQVGTLFDSELKLDQLFDSELKLDQLYSKADVSSGVEAVCRKKNGEPFFARVQGSDIETEDGKVRERLLIITDISKEKALEERLAISEKLAIYSELIAGIFHQINNPLVGVVNFSSVLLERMEEGNANRGLVETIHSAATQCRTLISSMVKGFREPESNFHRLALRECLEHAVEEVVRERQGAECSVEVVKTFTDPLPQINGDLLQLGQVFRNLLHNAFQAMPGGGKLEVGTSVNEANNEILVRFSDTGCGIPKENLTRIFTPFFSTKKNTGGGLGLSFAYQVIKSHAGRILVESVSGGTVFTIVLPFATDDKKTCEGLG